MVTGVAGCFSPGGLFLDPPVNDLKAAFDSLLFLTGESSEFPQNHEGGEDSAGTDMWCHPTERLLPKLLLILLEGILRKAVCSFSFPFHPPWSYRKQAQLSCLTAFPKACLRRKTPKHVTR